jgi:hypothetical protein
MKKFPAIGAAGEEARNRKHEMQRAEEAGDCGPKAQAFTQLRAQPWQRGTNRTSIIDPTGQPFPLEVNIWVVCPEVSVTSNRPLLGSRPSLTKSTRHRGTRMRTTVTVSFAPASAFFGSDPKPARPHRCRRYGGAATANERSTSGEQVSNER